MQFCGSRILIKFLKTGKKYVIFCYPSGHLKDGNHIDINYDRSLKISFTQDFLKFLFLELTFDSIYCSLNIL